MMHNTVTSLNQGWSFYRADVGTPLSQVRNAAFEPVTLPHDFALCDVAKLYESADGWYRRTLSAFPAPCRTVLRFDGVYMDSQVYVDDALVFEWKYGYTAFYADLTEALTGGEHEVYVRARYQCPNSRWYSGAGIYRDVSLLCLPKEHIEPDGVYINTVPEDNGYLVRVSVQTNAQEPYTVRHTLLDEQGNAVVTDAGDAFTVASPREWDIQSPVLYTLVTTLSRGGEALDEQRSAFGFRRICYDANDGFFLNGRRVKLQGVCQHHDLGALGAAFDETAAKRQLNTLREMGVNAIRMAHNPPALRLLSLCDQMGFLVIDEAFDMWERSKTAFDYARFFPEWHERDVKAWICRDRNHPSVVLWSIGNEIYDTHADARGLEVTKRLVACVKAHDPLGNAPIALCSNYLPWENTQKCADVVGIAGYNYCERYYKAHHARYPYWCIFGSETASIVTSRGIYHFPAKEALLSDDDLQCSSLGNSATSWGAQSLAEAIVHDRDEAYTLGMFLWSGFDYIGEPTPYHTKNSYFGQIDTAGFKKDHFYLMQAAWTKAPMVHLLPYWDWNEGQDIDVRIYSNQPRVRLYLDDALIGEQRIDMRSGTTLCAAFALPYAPGTLRAQALDESGRVTASDEQRSFGDAARIVLHPEQRVLSADGRDLAFLRILMRDRNGNPVRNANNRVRVRVEGAGALVGLDSGDSTDMDDYQSCSKRLFSGMLLAILRAGAEAGQMRVTVTSPGLPEESVTLPVLPCGYVGAKPVYPRIKENDIEEIPVRKIELRAVQSRALDPQHQSCDITVCILPHNATYHDLSWRVTNEAGVDTNIARLMVDGGGARVTALGDGVFCVRCMASNGGDHPEVMSTLTFRAAGLGEATINPYAFLSAGLASVRIGDVCNGNDRGLSIAPDGSGAFGFERVDFGHDGADAITLSVFALVSDPCRIGIWEGVPGSGGVKLIDAVYHKPSIWNTYQEQTFALPKRLTGIKTICFDCESRLHIKGVLFRRCARAYQGVPAASAEQIYGDSYAVEGECVMGIGNNVTLHYAQLDLGAGATRLMVRGKSALARSTIHVKLTQGESVRHESLEFDGCGEWTERAFDIAPLRGVYDVDFVFLPGSAFDLCSFRFE